jgi:RND family efflux transporter MFP subunit
LPSSCKDKKQEQAKIAAIPVKTIVVKRRELAAPILTSGRLYPKTMIKLSFKVGGLIDKLNVEEGDSARKGQVLASLDLSEINARFNQADNAYLKAQRDLGRVKNLYKDRAATLEQLQNMETAFSIAESNLEIAKFNLDHSHIKAPANGKILKRLAEAGEMVGTGAPIFIFGSTENHWIIKVGIAERDIMRIQLKDKALINFDAYQEKKFPAAVSEISEAMDPASGTYEIELAVSDKGIRLAAGFAAKVRIEPSQTELFFVIPIDAIVEGEGSDGVVFTIRDNKAIKVKIKVAHIFPETAAVRSGLEHVENVVTSGAAYLTEGAAVKVVN